VIGSAVLDMDLHSIELAFVNLSGPLRETLIEVADLCAPAADPWWIISSAAVALHGAEIDQVRDVDVLMSVHDAAAALLRAGARHDGGQGAARFRSQVFGVWSGAPLPVEIFGGFEFAGAEGWTPVRPQTRHRVELDGRGLFVPAAAELRAMLIGFARPKDLARARLL
jgi:hypothetical protein